MDEKELEQMIIDNAMDCEVDPDLALAIAYVESEIDTLRARYEPFWRYFVTPEKFATDLRITLDTERILQAMSWSCLQIMGSNARALGYKGQLTLLIQPSLGILYGCKYIQKLEKRFQNELDVISAYNQGYPAMTGTQYKNQRYVDRVTARLKQLRGIHTTLN